MPYIITCLTKSLTLAITPFLLILVGVLCEIAMMPGVEILLSPQEEKVHYFSWGHKCTHLNLCLKSYDYAKVIVEFEKTQTRKSAVLWDQVAIWISNLFLVSVNVSEQSFPY